MFSLFSKALFKSVLYINVMNASPNPMVQFYCFRTPSANVVENFPCEIYYLAIIIK